MGEFASFALVPEQGIVPEMAQLDALNEFRFINLESEMDVLADMLAGDGLITPQKQSAKAEEKDPFGTLFAQEER